MEATFSDIYNQLIKEGQLRDMFIHAPVAVMILKGGDYLVELSNDFYFKVNEDDKNGIGKPLFELMPGFKTNGVKDVLDNVMQRGIPSYGNQLECGIYSDTNNKKETGFFNVDYKPIFDNKAIVTGVIVVATQLSGQLTANKKLEESLHSYTEIIYSSPSLIAILKGEKNIITIANKAIVEIWGKGDDVIGKPFLEALPELVEQNIAELLHNVYTTGIPFHANEMPVNILRYGKMELRYYSYVFQPHRNATGLIEGVAIIGSEVTSQALFNKTIKESEERFRSLADDVPLFIFIIEPNADATISYWNKYWLDYTGQTFEEAIGRTWDGIVHPADVAIVLSVYVPAFEKQQYYFIPGIRVKRRDGEYRWHSVRANPRYSPTGEFIGFIGIGIDIHESKLAEESLKLSEARFRNLVEKAPVAICVLRGENYVIEVINEGMFEMWDRTLEQALNKPAFEVLPELMDQGFKELLDTVYYKGERFVSQELPINLRRNGKLESAFVKFIYEPLRDADGTVSGVMALAHEITEQVINRKKIEAQAVMVQELFMTAPGFICTLTGPQHVYEVVNEKYQQLFGKRKLQGKALLKALPELEGQGFDLLLDNVYNTGVPYVGIDMLITIARDENLTPEPAYFNFSYQPIYDEHKIIYSILVFGYEVTEQVIAKNKNLETQQIRARELEEKVQQRTIELMEANEELQQKNQLIAVSKYNKQFLTEFSERFSDHKLKNEFFNSLVQFIADTTLLHYAFVGKLVTDGESKIRVETIAITAFGKLSENIHYPLKDGPCEQVIRGTVYDYPENCRIIFPKNETLVQFNVEGYLGVPLYDAAENAVGLIAVMHEKKIEDSETVSAMLRILAKRAEIEFERIKNEEILEENNKILAQKNQELEQNNQLLKQKNEEIAITTEKLLTEYSRSLIEASHDPLVTINPAGKITDMNQATIDITGKSRKKLTGTDFFDYFTDAQKAREVYQEIFAKGFVTDYPLTIMDHKLTDVLFNGSVYKDGLGNVLGAVVVARDITDQKRIEKELIEAKEFAELATGIAEIAKNNAESATQTATDAVKSKQQFLSNMSHEIRTPMNAIIGFTKVVLKTDLSAKQKEYLTAIKMSGDALIVLINDILDLAKVDAGKMTFEQIPFKMALSISAMLHLFETKIQEKNLLLVKEYDNKIPEVLVGDPVRLHQIILNLVSNAVKFTQEGRITVSVRMIDEDAEKVRIEFSIKDTGIGITENKLEKIFENFQQASSGTSRLYGGTGLGLAIVKQLVEAQGGTISVTSKLHEGAVFTFMLHFKKTKAEAMLSEPIVELNTEIQNIKVLVVEDIPLNQLLMKTLLDDFGFIRDVAANGKIAIEKLKTNEYDIILMDLQMPEMNGFDATAYIRDTMHSQIPIIALTADVTTADLEKCKAVGMNDYLAKPVDEKVLYSKIIGLLKKPVFTNTPKINKPVVEAISFTNLAYLKERTKSNPALMKEMISLYLQQTPSLITDMKQSLLNKDWNLLHAVVHKMIPSFSIVGIDKKFENMAKEVQEYSGGGGQLNRIPALVAQLEIVCLQACEELEETLKTFKNTGL